MHLIIDIGNTSVKTALFKKGKLIHLKRIQLEKLFFVVSEISKRQTIKYALISSVGNLTNKNRQELETLFTCIELTHKSKLPFYNKYGTPKTLGVDRLALVSAAVSQFPNTNVLVIDAGTCVTYDFVTHNKDYFGGAISPGVKSRYKSLHDYTENLPLLEKQIPENLIGDSTTNSIHSGVVNGICREIDGVISQYLEIHKKLTVVLTGGDAEFLSSQLKNSIFVRPFFLVEGLYTILKYNIK